jgi:hypothetical protein
MRGYVDIARRLLSFLIQCRISSPAAQPRYAMRGIVQYRNPEDTQSCKKTGGENPEHERPDVR